MNKFLLIITSCALRILKHHRQRLEVAVIHFIAFKGLWNELLHAFRTGRQYARFPSSANRAHIIGNTFLRTDLPPTTKGVKELISLRNLHHSARAVIDRVFVSSIMMHRTSQPASQQINFLQLQQRHDGDADCSGKAIIASVIRHTNSTQHATTLSYNADWLQQSIIAQPSCGPVQSLREFAGLLSVLKS